MRWGATIALAAITCSLTLGTAVPTEARPVASWSVDLAAGDAVGIALDGGSARLDPGRTFASAAEADQAAGGPLPTGLLTFPPHAVDTPTDRVTAVLDGALPAGASAGLDVRARRSTGGWTEWIPADGDASGLTAALPAPSSEVQARLVLAGDVASGPVVRGMRLTAHPATAPLQADGGERAPLTYQVFATREGLVGATTANGHVIGERDQFVALPSRRALAPRGSGDYTVKVCSASGRCAFAPVWDVGPWNTRDDYWNPPEERQQWRDLPQGLPQAQAARLSGHNGGRDQYNREVANPAGIDLGDGMFWDALGLTDNGWVSVEYLWTGSSPLAAVAGAEEILAAPTAAAAIVGIVADRATVPVQCLLTAGVDRWLQIGTGQFLTADAVPGMGAVPDCPHGGP
jgi:hypothetical protein